MDIFDNKQLPGDYIAGFVDGEGCFALNFRRDLRSERKNQPDYFYWRAEFAITLREDDKEILYLIKNTLGCGKVHDSNSRGAVRYQVSKFDDLAEKIMPFFKNIH